MEDINTKILELINRSSCQFQAIENIKKELDDNKYIQLKEGDEWNIGSGKFYTTRNNSSIIAFDIPDNIKDYHFQLCASHSDSPTFKIKCESELEGPNEYLRINVEQYGGSIFYTWLDKPLSIAGRVLVKQGNKVVSKNISIDDDLLLIPSMPIHMNRDINKGYEFNVQVDLCPLFSNGVLKKGDFKKMLAEYIQEEVSSIVSYDLYLVNRQKGSIWGYKKEFISAPKLDDLQAAFTSLLGFIESENKDCIKVYCCFDNEEVGSGTKQGALSTFLYDVLKRVNNCLNKDDDQYHRAIAKSYLVSFDNAHALHPNHPEKYDVENRCYMNSGIVIKENANQLYTTDSFSRAIFKEICLKANVPIQNFANKSDLRGGSTLGNLSNRQVSLHTVDIGLPQLAMHSSYETAGSKDSEYAYEALKEYYQTNIVIKDADEFELK